MTNVLVTGGAGYVGSVMVPQLLANGYRVTVYDILFFGREGLPDHPNLKVIEGDIRDTPRLATALEGIDVVLHLACISNDPSFELDEGLSKTINYDCFEPLVLAAKAARVKRFVYCSSSSVYGVSDKPDVTEDHPLVPLTLYNKYKGLCEPLLFKHQAPGFTCVTQRSAPSRASRAITAHAYRVSSRGSSFVGRRGELFVSVPKSKTRIHVVLVVRLTQAEMVTVVWPARTPLGRVTYCGEALLAWLSVSASPR